MGNCITSTLQRGDAVRLTGKSWERLGIRGTIQHIRNNIGEPTFAYNGAIYVIYGEPGMQADYSVKRHREAVNG